MQIASNDKVFNRKGEHIGYALLEVPEAFTETEYLQLERKRVEERERIRLETERRLAEIG